MELRHLRSFVAVAEECHFGRAADRLFIAQPPLSQQIIQLESDLGVALLERSTRRVSLTAAGASYLVRAREILATVDAAGREANLVAAGQIGSLRIGFTGSATYELLPVIARAVRSSLPGLDLDLRGEMLTPRQVEALLNHQLDLCFLRPPVPPANLHVKVLRREQLVAVLPDGHRLATKDRISLKDLSDEAFVSYPSHHRSVVYAAVIEACAVAGFTPVEVQEVGETSTLVAFVAAGFGVALVPASVQHLQITGAVYRELDLATAGIELAMVTRADDDSPHLARVLDVVRGLIPLG